MNVIDQERWRPIRDFDGYEVSDMGRVRSWLSHSGGRRSEPLVLRPTMSNRYLRVSLYKCRRQHSKSVHLLVLEAFVGPCPVGQQGRHVSDHDTTNNALSNLAWGTPKQNAEDRDRHGRTRRGEVHYLRTDPSRASRGESVGTSKLTEHDVRSMLADGAVMTTVALGKKYGVSQAMAHNIVNRKSWRHVS